MQKDDYQKQFSFQTQISSTFQPMSVPTAVTDSYELSHFFFQNHKSQFKKIIKYVFDNVIILFDSRLKGRNLSLSMHSYSSDLKAMTLNVKYQQYTFLLEVFFTQDKSYAHHVTSSFSGSYASTYLINIFSSAIAIKCHHFDSQQSNSFQTTFKNVILQYVMLLIASKLAVGPYMNKIFGFDIIVYHDCIEFAMENCAMNMLAAQNMADELKQCLKLMHSHRFVHFDIKPENIGYSTYFQKYVFIDFGLSQIVTETQGQKQVRNFKGSLIYCSDQFKMCYIQRRMKVDAYFNDCYCLEKSLIQIGENKLSIIADKILSSDLSCLLGRDLSCQYLKLRIKYYKYNMEYESTNYLKFFKENKKLFFKCYNKDEINEILIEFNQYFQSTLMNNYRDYFKFTDQHVKVSLNTQKDRLTDVKYQNCRIGGFIKYESGDYVNKYSVADLVNQQKIKSIQMEQYFLQVSYLLVIDQEVSTFQDKINICQIFAKLYLNCDEKGQKLIAGCIDYLFDFSFTGPLTEIKLMILNKVIITATIFQYKSESDYIDYFQKVLQMKTQSNTQLQILLKYMIALMWIKCRLDSKYNFRTMNQHIIKSLRLFIVKYRTISLSYASLVQVFQVRLFQMLVQFRTGDEEAAFKYFQRFSNCLFLILGNIKVLMFQSSFMSLIIDYWHCYLFQRYQLLKSALNGISYNHLQLSEKKRNNKYPTTFQFYLFTLYINYYRDKSFAQMEKLFQKYTKFFGPYSFYRHYKIYLENIYIMYQRTNISDLQMLKLLPDFNKFKCQFRLYYQFTTLNYLSIQQKEQFKKYLKINQSFFQNYLQCKLQIYQFQKKYHKNMHNLGTVINQLKFALQVIYNISNKTIKDPNTCPKILKLYKQFHTLISSITDKIDCFKCKFYALIQLASISFFVMYYQHFIVSLTK